jgi:integrase
LRVKDVDFGQNQLIVRRGKGQKDRITVLPAVVQGRLDTHLEEVRRMHTRDLGRSLGRVVLPFALELKYPQAPTDWGWQFVFPAGRVCRDARWGAPSRYHLHESVVQRAVAQACVGPASSSP